MTTLILSELASILGQLTMNPKNLLDDTPNAYFFLVELHLIFTQDIKHLRQVGNLIFCLQAFDQHVVYIYLHSLPF